MKIRKATGKDKEIIKKIFSEGYSVSPYNEKWPPEMLEKRISDYLKYYDNMFVLEVDKKIVGFIIFCFYAWHAGLRGYINEVVVAPEFQGKGYGRALMDFAESYMKKKGAKEVCLLTSPESGAFKMYQKRNYKDEGFVTVYKVLK
jgi:ribosomal protein S18 acetylase RimI-like enzyme